jgi:hypothetical protein
MAFSHTPAEYKDVWPAMPWVLRKVVIPYVLAKRHAGYAQILCQAVFQPHPLSLVTGSMLPMLCLDDGELWL